MDFMADNCHLKEFSPDRKLFAAIQNDGKLKIWDIEKSRLIQEYVPNLHLSTPCTAIKWIRLSTGQKVINDNIRLTTYKYNRISEKIKII